ncbi:MAG: protein kinase [Selenomonas sp.]|uniref:protein kinase n=1 Tax=Selenomonas sp. TaxID=2053611 RepID=UPI0025FD4D11|nr:protein kinase [Selenomonas sp.]MCR5439135.1 protein kinase [Selenomonas sp.]
MARTVNYEEKIKLVSAKIEKKQSEIKALKAELETVKEKQAKVQYAELLEYMQANNLSAKEILELIKD